MVINRNQAASCVGISIVAGVLWYGVASDPSQRALQERISLLFFSTTLFTFAPLYAAIARMKERMRLAEQELDKCLINPGPFVLATAMADAMLHSVWPVVYSLICFSLADCARSPGAMAWMALIVTMCNLANHSLGVFLAVLVPQLPSAMAAATFFAQTAIAAAGFYRTVPLILGWYGYLSLSGYAFEGLLISEFSWADTYSCRPNQQTALWAGRGSCFLETSRVVDELHLRGLRVAVSPLDLSPAWDVGALACCVVAARLLAFAVLCRRRSTQRLQWGQRCQDSNGKGEFTGLAHTDKDALDKDRCVHAGTSGEETQLDDETTRL